MNLAAADDVLSRLVARSLIVAEQGRTGRYSMLRSTATYFEERFAASDDERFVRDRHARFFRDLGEEKLSSHPTRRWTDRAPYLADQANFRAAMDWTLFGEGERDDGVRLVAAVAPLWEYGPHKSAIEPYMLRALDVAATPLQRAQVLLNLASYKDFGGRHHEARDLASQALAIFRSERLVFLMERTLTRLASAMHFSGDTGGALDYGREALELAESIDDLAGTVAALANLSMIAANATTLPPAVADDYLRRAETARASGRRPSARHPVGQCRHNVLRARRCRTGASGNAKRRRRY